MVLARFRFEKKRSVIFGYVHRPVARVDFWSRRINGWVEVVMMVDTGADYTLLPGFYAKVLGIDLRKDCLRFSTMGIGGTEPVYLLRKRQRARLGLWEGRIPVGFLNRDDVPPLLGRQNFMERLRVIMERHTTTFHGPARK